MRRSLMGVLVGLLMATAAQAQDPPVINPRFLEFESPDHNAKLADATTDVIQRYEVCWRVVGAGACLQTSDVGKPAQVGEQNGNPLIRIDTTALTRPLPATFVYEATATAIGPLGVGASVPSLPSNPFQQAAVPRTPVSLRVRSGS